MAYQGFLGFVYSVCVHLECVIIFKSMEIAWIYKFLVEKKFRIDIHPNTSWDISNDYVL